MITPVLIYSLLDNPKPFRATIISEVELCRREVFKKVKEFFGYEEYMLLNIAFRLNQESAYLISVFGASVMHIDRINPKEEVDLFDFINGNGQSKLTIKFIQ